MPSRRTWIVPTVAGFTHNSTSRNRLVAFETKAQFRGSGAGNGAGDHGFPPAAIDGQDTGGGLERFRLRVLDRAAGVEAHARRLGAADGAGPAIVIRGRIEQGLQTPTRNPFSCTWHGADQNWRSAADLAFHETPSNLHPAARRHSGRGLAPLPAVPGSVLSRDGDGMPLSDWRARSMRDTTAKHRLRLHRRRCRPAPGQLPIPFIIPMSVQVGPFNTL